MFSNKNWKKELARDFIALGSWVFYVLVIARILVLPYRWPYLYQIIFAGIFILILEIFIKRMSADYYISRALVLVIFTILFYDNKIFTIFAILTFIGLIISSYFIGNDWKKIIKGLIIGGIISIISLLLSDFSHKLINFI